MKKICTFLILAVALLHSNKVDALQSIVQNDDDSSKDENFVNSFLTDYKKYKASNSAGNVVDFVGQHEPYKGKEQSTLRKVADFVNKNSQDPKFKKLNSSLVALLKLADDTALRALPDAVFPRESNPGESKRPPDFFMNVIKSARNALRTTTMVASKNLVQPLDLANVKAKVATIKEAEGDNRATYNAIVSFLAQDPKNTITGFFKQDNLGDNSLDATGKRIENALSLAQNDKEYFKNKDTAANLLEMAMFDEIASQYLARSTVLKEGESQEDSRKRMRSNPKYESLRKYKANLGTWFQQSMKEGETNMVPERDVLSLKKFMQEKQGTPTYLSELHKRTLDLIVKAKNNARDMAVAVAANKASEPIAEPINRQQLLDDYVKYVASGGSCFSAFLVSKYANKGVLYPNQVAFTLAESIESDRAPGKELSRVDYYLTDLIKTVQTRLESNSEFFPDKDFTHPDFDKFNKSANKLIGVRTPNTVDNFNTYLKKELELIKKDNKSVDVLRKDPVPTNPQLPQKKNAVNKAKFVDDKLYNGAHVNTKEADKQVVNQVIEQSRIEHNNRFKSDAEFNREIEEAKNLSQMGTTASGKWWDNYPEISVAKSRSVDTKKPVQNNRPEFDLNAVNVAEQERLMKAFESSEHSFDLNAVNVAEQERLMKEIEDKRKGSPVLLHPLKDDEL